MRWYHWILIIQILFSAGILGASAETTKTKDDPCSDAESLSKGITAPVLIKKVEPEFAKAKGEHAGSPIIVEAVVTKEGSLACIKLLRSNDEELNQIFLDALSQWKYKPASKKGKPVPIRLTIMATIDVK